MGPGDGYIAAAFIHQASMLLTILMGVTVGGVLVMM